VSDGGYFVTDQCLVRGCIAQHKAGDGPCDIAHYCEGCGGWGFVGGARGLRGCPRCGGNGVRKDPESARCVNCGHAPAGACHTAEGRPSSGCGCRSEFAPLAEVSRAPD
jgi:hypothetical protein